MLTGRIKGSKKLRKLLWRDGSLVLAIMVLALALRVVYLFQARGQLYFNNFADSLYYHNWAQSIIQGQAWSPVFFMGPLYPNLLAIFYRLLGPHPEAILWFQVLLGTASCGFIYLLGRLAFGRIVGLLAALMGALYAVEIFYEGALLTTTSLYFLNLLLLVSIFWVLRQNRWYLWAIPGFLLGLSALGRANVLSFLPFLILGIFLLTRSRGTKGLRWVPSALAVLLSVFVVLIPVTLHNVVLGHDLVLMTSNLGLNFFVGNNSDAPGYYEKPKGLDLGADPTGAEIAGIFMGKELKPSEVSRFWLQRALAFVKDQPGAFLRLTLNKFFFFWNAYEIPQMENFYFFKRFAPVLRWPLLSFSVLGPLGILGIALSLRSWRESYFLFAFVVSLMGANVLFFVLARFRLQVCAALMVFATYSLRWMWKKLRTAEIHQLVVAVLALVPLILFVNWSHSALNSTRNLARAHNSLAMYLWKAGDLKGAEREYARAEAVYPYLGDTYVNLANLRLVQDRAEEVLGLYMKALQVDPQIPMVHLNMGNWHAQQGKWDLAIREYRAELKFNPYNWKAHEGLSKVLKEKEKEEGG